MFTQQIVDRRHKTVKLMAVEYTAEKWTTVETESEAVIHGAQNKEETNLNSRKRRG